MKDVRRATTPTPSEEILTKDAGGQPRKEEWNYRSVIGMLNFLVNFSHPEMAYVVHQYARICIDSKRSHEKVVKRIIRYLIGTIRIDRNKREANQVIIYSPDKSKSVETFVDASFSGDWNQSWSEESTSVMSRTGYVMMYANFPIIWCSKLQTKITLSTTESEYVALSHSLKGVIPLLALLKKLKEVIPREESIPKVHCSVFDNNKRCTDMVKASKMRPRP